MENGGSLPDADVRIVPDMLRGAMFMSAVS